MAERKASDLTANLNLSKIMRELERPGGYSQADELASINLRKELAAKGLKGFKRGGKVKKTGPAKLHKGERVLTVKQAKKATPTKLRTALKRTPKPRGRRS